MRRFLIVFAGALLGVAFLANASMAQRVDPAKAKKYQSNAVNAYQACTVANDTTLGSLPLAACHPAVLDDSNCSMDAGGGGKVAAKSDPAGDVALQIKLKGITGCDGETLQGIASVRVTTNNCNSADPNGCTVIDLNDFPVTAGGSCLVDKGQCKVKTSVNTELGAGTLAAGDDVSITIGGVGVKRTTGAGTKGKVAVSGVGIP